LKAWKSVGGKLTVPPKVSIVIPVHNGMPYIKESVQSAINQDYAHTEIIVVENASQDGTAQWLRTLQTPQVRVIYRDELQSAADNWTQAVETASGEFTKLLCADDILDSEIVSTQVQQLRENPTAVMAACRRRIINSQGHVMKKSHGLSGLNSFENGSSALKKCLLAGSNLFGEPATVLFRSAVIKQVMPWQSRWPYVTDLATYARVLRHGDLVTDPRVQASFRISVSSWSASLLSQQREQFALWQASELDSGFISLSRTEKFTSKVQLNTRTLVRKLFFLRETRRTQS
jgi:glycosyltransferase involved in cell wall biosynthesis